jgi:hypothetical protein
VQELGNALARWLSQRGYCDDITGMLLKSNWPSAASAGEDQAQSRAPAHPPTTRPPFDAGSSMPAPGFASVTMTLDGLYPEHAAASTAREPSLIAARPSEPPAPVLPLCSVLPESSRSRWSAWGLSSKASKR